MPDQTSRQTTTVTQPGRHDPADIELIAKAIFLNDFPDGTGAGEAIDGLLGDYRQNADAVLDALAGRLLPVQTETRTEWGVWWHAGRPDGIVLDEYRIGSQMRAERRAKERLGEYGIDGYTIIRREHRQFADDSSWTGDWVKVSTETPVDSSSVNLADPLEALLDMPIGIRFWVCPMPGHSDRNGPDGRPVVTVEWRGDIAYCTAPGCNRSSQPTTAEEQP